MMNKLEHKSNILENGGIETALEKKHFSIFDLIQKLKKLLLHQNNTEND